MKTLGIRAQLALAFGALTVLLLAVATLSMVNFQTQFDMFEH